MKAVCQISINPIATSQQIKEIGDDLERWSDRQMDECGCLCEIDTISLEDILAGELPKPEVLKQSHLYRKIEQFYQTLETEDFRFKPEMFERIKEALGEDANARVVMIHISYAPEFGYKDSIEELRQILPSDLVAGLSVMELESDVDDDLGDLGPFSMDDLTDYPQQ